MRGEIAWGELVRVRGFPDDVGALSVRSASASLSGRHRLRPEALGPATVRRCPYPNQRTRSEEKGARATPRSVMMALISSAGVTSKAGLRTCTPAGAQRSVP